MMSRAALVVCATAIALLLAEGFVRLLLPAYRPSRQVQFIPGPEGVALGPPNTTLRAAKNTGDYDVTVAFNDLGLRDTKPLRASTPESLFVVGDSFAFGWGVEARERFSDVVQERLGRPVFNVSAAGADFDGYETLVRYAETNGARIGALVITVCMENDLHPYEPVTGTIGRPQPIGALKRYLTAHSAAYTIATIAIHRVPWLERLATGVRLVTHNLAAIAESDISDVAVRASEARLRRIIGDRRAIVLIIPSRALWVGTDDHRRRTLAAHEAFVRALRADGVHVVDLRERFEEGGQPLQFHFAKDGHWNRQGQRLAADALTEEIVGLGF